MRRIIILLFILFLCSCSKKMENPKCEKIESAEAYSEFVSMAAKDHFEGYLFIDLRSDLEYNKEFVSNFYPSNHIAYNDNIDDIIKHIEKGNKYGNTLCIVLIDESLEDITSSNVYEILIEKNYTNVKDVTIGFKGLKDDYILGYSYTIRNSLDCDC